MAGMILTKNFIFSISRCFPQTQSLFFRSSSSSTHKFSRATTFTASAKEKLAETGERTTVMSQKVKHKAAELKDRTKESAQEMKETAKPKSEGRTKDIGRRSVADKAKQGCDKASECSAQNVKGKTMDMAGKTDQEANKEKQKHWKKPPEGGHVLSTRKHIAGIGGPIRNKNGSIVAAFAAGIPTAPIAAGISTAPIPRRAPVCIEVMWQPPSIGWIKANTDGSVTGDPSSAACGGVFRDHQGMFMGGFSVRIDSDSSSVAELTAVIVALTCAKDRGWHSIWIECDSVMVIQAFGNPDLVPSHIRAAWLDCLGWTSSLVQFKLSHIYREGNCVADALAAVGHDYPDLHWWSSPPSIITGYLTREQHGLPSHRFRT